MRWLERSRSLGVHAFLWIVLPVTLVMLSLIAGGIFAYQQVVTSLLIERDRQLAVLSAVRVSEVMDGYAHVLEVMAGNAGVGNSSAETRARALMESAEALDIFNRGVVIADRDGNVDTIFPAGESPVGASIAGQDYFQSVRDGLKSAYSNVVTESQTGDKLIVIAVPILNPAHQFSGVLLGAMSLHDNALGAPIEKLVIGEQGFAYLVDRQGRIIFHPELGEIGADYGDRPFVSKAIGGETGGTLWSLPSGKQQVKGYAPVAATGWGLIVTEPWESVVAPIQVYREIVVLAGMVAIVLAGFLSWRGVRRIAAPIRALAEQTTRLAQGENFEPIAPSGITEVDTLEGAFSRMAAQLASYRAGIQRYVGAITQSQEDERRRIARELHDETVQSLLAIARQLELYQTAEQDPERIARLAELQQVVSETLHGVRQISRDLRPPVLEDLGLVPALHTLVRAAREGVAAIPHVKLDVSGEPLQLNAERELALYRITQEALTNIRKHAQATDVHIQLRADATTVRIEVCDNGKGFDLPASFSELARRGSFGLMGIQERVWAIGGSLSVKSRPGEGTRLTVTVPVETR